MQLQGGSARPVYFVDPNTLQIIVGSAIPVVAFDGNGVGIDFAANGNDGELQYNNGGIRAGTPNIVFSNTAIEMRNNATVWKDINIGSTSLGIGATAPDLIALAAGNINIRAFDGNAITEQLFGVVELDHDWKEGSAIIPHVHWVPVNTDVGNVNWQLDYSWTNTDAVVGAGANINVVVAAPGVAWQSTFTNFPEIDGAGFLIGSQFAFRLFRDPTDTDTYGSDAGLLTFGIHVELDTIGSRTATAK